MFNNIVGKVYAGYNGIQVFDDAPAVLGWTPTEGQTFAIAVDGWCYKNYSITDDTFTGDEIEYNEGVWGYTQGCTTSNTAQGDAQFCEYTIPQNEANENLRCAVYLARGGTAPDDYAMFGIQTYNTSTHVWGQALPFQYTTLDSDLSMFVISTPDSAPPGYVQQLSTTPENILGRANTIRGAVPAEYAGIYYNRTNIACNVPIFDTQEHARAYLQDETDETIDGILNLVHTDPEHDYINDQKYYKMKNLFARGSGSSWTPIQNINYRIKPVGGKICLYKTTPTAGQPYEWRLKGWRNGYDFYASDGIVYDDDDDFYNISDVTETFLEHSLKFDNVSYRVNIFDTDVPKWENEQDADDYINGLKDITEALNYDYIARTNQEILGPDIGLADAGNDNGTNGMVYSYGSRMYVMSSSHLAGFFADVFDTANINDILAGTQLFGTNQINAISGINYFPCAISEFCNVASVGATPHVGSWVCPTATSNGYVTQNNKLIDCGGDYLKPIYNDFRDLEPYQQLWVTLPFCGTHQLQLTKYLNKYMSFKYSIDAVTGACSCHVYADGIEFDTFDGVCSSQRPITAIDQTTYLSNVIGSVNSALSSGVGVVSSGAQAIGGAVTGNALSVASGLGGVAGSGASGVLGAYNVLQAVDNPPMVTRGGSSGCLGFFGCTQIHLHFYQKKTVKPVHALMLCGAPSNVSGTVSSFAGFLKCSTFKMSDGFTGTNDELNEIMQLMKNGIYV
ncbi:MAG: hypothetical protein IIW86_05075 [Clostridia bacterium]|nr:hypothetical protein [Clostridia bacterium]